MKERIILNLTENWDQLHQYSLKFLVDHKNRFEVIYPSSLRNHPLIAALKKSRWNKFKMTFSSMIPISDDYMTSSPEILLKSYLNFLQYTKPDKPELLLLGISFVNKPLLPLKLFFPRTKDFMTYNFGQKVRYLLWLYGFGRLNSALKWASKAVQQCQDRLTPFYIHSQFWAYNFSAQALLIRFVLSYLMRNMEDVYCYEDELGRLKFKELKENALSDEISKEIRNKKAPFKGCLE